METVRTVARENGPHGEVVLRRRSGVGPDVDELIIDGIFAMDSSETFTEQALAQLALAGQVQRRVLLGGLGLGFTAAQLLTADVDHLDVVEIEECLIGWAYAGLTPTLAAVAHHPRTALHAGDVGTVLAGLKPVPKGPWNAIVLDVDNGPDFLIHGVNAALYTERSLTAAYGQLAGGGTLAIWCQGPAPELLDTLQQISASATPHTFQRVREGRRLSYVIYTVTRPRAGAFAERQCGHDRTQHR
jgi:spermidine synthase